MVRQLVEKCDGSAFNDLLEAFMPSALSTKV